MEQLVRARLDDERVETVDAFEMDLVAVGEKQVRVVIDDATLESSINCRDDKMRDLTDLVMRTLQIVRISPVLASLPR